MSKFRKLIEEKNLSTYDLTKSTGLKNRADIVEDVLAGKRELTNTNFNILSSFARGLGVPLTEILESFDIDGTSSQVINIKRIIDRIKKPGKKFKDVVYRVQNIPEDKFVIGTNLDEGLTNYNKFKIKFEFINPNLDHDKQYITVTDKLNAEYLKTPIQRYNMNTTLNNLSNKLNSLLTSVMVITPIKYQDKIIGGDFKLGVTVRDTQDNFLFSEIYGCEYMDTEDNKNIVYYKAVLDKPLTAELMESIPKQEISELEFNNALYSQFWKYGLSK